MEDTMRTNIVIDDSLMEEALKHSDHKTKKDTVEEALKLFITIKGQSEIKKYRGKLHWEGDLAAMRND